MGGQAVVSVSLFCWSAIYIHHRRLWNPLTTNPLRACCTAQQATAPGDPRHLAHRPALATADARTRRSARLLAWPSFRPKRLLGRYGTEEMILSFPPRAWRAHSDAAGHRIVILLAILTLSYEQIIDAYPSAAAPTSSCTQPGRPARIDGRRGAVTDYILTVAVSISSVSRRSPPRFPLCIQSGPGSPSRRCSSLSSICAVSRIRGSSPSPPISVAMMYVTMVVGCPLRWAPWA